MKHLLKLLDLSTEEIIDILNLADQLKYAEARHSPQHLKRHDSGHDLPEVLYKNPRFL